MRDYGYSNRSGCVQSRSVWSTTARGAKTRIGGLESTLTLRLNTDTCLFQASSLRPRSPIVLIYGWCKHIQSATVFPLGLCKHAWTSACTRIAWCLCRGCLIDPATWRDIREAGSVGGGGGWWVSALSVLSYVGECACVADHSGWSYRKFPMIGVGGFHMHIETLLSEGKRNKNDWTNR